MSALPARATGASYPPGDTSFSPARAARFVRDPLSMLLESYERFGPIFTLRLAAYKVVFMLGPEATHYMTVANAANFSWGSSMLREFSPVGGEGLFLVDGERHDRAREAIAPAFNRARLLESIEVMMRETERALGEIAPGSCVDVYAWSRELTVQILLRGLLGLDPDGDPARAREISGLLDVVEAYFSTFALRLARGPFTPWARLKRAMRALDGILVAEIARRRGGGERGGDVLSLLLDATDAAGRPMGEGEILDHLKTLIFTGQDSTTSTLALLLYELDRHPEVLARLRQEQAEMVVDGNPTPQQLLAGELPYLEAVLDETLRRYAPPWLGPRRSRAAFEFDGHTVPAGAHVAYSMWATHHLADVFEDPFAFRPERFLPERRSTIPKGAFAPFGGGPRMCLGTRFARAQIRTVVTQMLARFEPRLAEGYELRIDQIPTVSPKGGMPMILGPRSEVACEPAGVHGGA